MKVSHCTVCVCMYVHIITCMHILGLCVNNIMYVHSIACICICMYVCTWAVCTYRCTCMCTHVHSSCICISEEGKGTCVCIVAEYRYVCIIVCTLEGTQSSLVTCKCICVCIVYVFLVALDSRSWIVSRLYPGMRPGRRMAFCSE